MANLEKDVEAYAALAAEIADPRTDRAFVLQSHGLTEASWDALDNHWQSRMSDDPDHNEVGMPKLLAAYAEAFAKAHYARGKSILSFDRFLDLAREIRQGQDLATLTERTGVTLSDFMASQKHWTSRMMEDDELARRFREAMR